MMSTPSSFDSEHKNVSMVSFGDVSVREFEVIPSDSPSVSVGAGIQLGWRYNIPYDKTPIDEFEEERKLIKHYRLRPLPEIYRRHKLLEFGFSYREIIEASKSAARQRKAREKSLRWMLMKENVGATFKRLMPRQRGRIKEEVESKSLKKKTNSMIDVPPQASESQQKTESTTTQAPPTTITTEQTTSFQQKTNSMIDVPPQASNSHQKTESTTTQAPPTTITTEQQTTSFQQQDRTSHQNTHQAARYSSHQDYNLGDTVRSPHHMIVEPNRSTALEAVDTLSNHDFAFVKRSGGRYTYAMLAYRTKGTCKGVHQERNSPSFSSLSISPRESEEEEKEETMTFVLKDDGCDKVIKKSQWADNVRLISKVTTSSTAASSNIERSEKAMITILPPAISYKHDKACAMKEDDCKHY